MRSDITEDSEPVAEGFLDHVDGTIARGWAVTKGGSSPLLVLRVDGRIVQTFRPNLSRPDLQNAYPGNALGFETPVFVKPDSEVAVLDAFGNHLTGSPARPQLSREQKVITRINKSMRVLEIGGGYSPFATKAGGWNSFSLDHATREQLVAKYAAHGRDTSRVEDVDFLWTGGPLESAIPPQQLGSFDACIASHLIEHIPDPISFYNSLGRILNPDGVISLVVPDKRFIFDFFRPISTTSQLIEAHRQKRTRHTKMSAFDDCALNCHLRGNITWDASADASDVAFINPNALGRAFAIYESHDEASPSDYVDMHGWVYTPSSFALIILELNAGELIDWIIDIAYSTFGCEFFVTLKRTRDRLSSEEIQRMRFDLNKRIILELGEQAALLRRECH